MLHCDVLPVAAAGAGYSGPSANCGTTCGGSNGANFSPAGRAALTPAADSTCATPPCFNTTVCESCPSITTGYFFTGPSGANRPYIPPVVARTRAESQGNCLAGFAQIGDPAWYLGGAAPMVEVTNLTGSLFDACASNCFADKDCQYITFDYTTNKCFKKARSDLAETHAALK